MKASTKRILSIALSGFLFIGTLIVYSNFIRPAATEVGAKRSVLFSKSTTFNSQKEAVSRVQELIARLKGAARLEETVSLLIPTKPGVTEALAQLRAITESSGVRLQSFSIAPLPLEPSTSPLVRRLGVLELGLSVAGSYESVKQFLQAIETNVRIFNVKSLTIAPTREGGFIGQFSVQVYYQE